MKSADNVVAIEESPASDPNRRADYTGIGKIARLPVAIRHELNLRLMEGQEGKQLVAWLNGLPEVQAVMAAHFHGHPIGEMNLSRWKSGGYQHWCDDQIAVHAVARVFEQSDVLQRSAQGGLTDRLNLVLMAKIALQLQRLDRQPDSEDNAKACRELVASLALLKRGESQDERLRLEREKLEFRRRLCEEEFLKWSARRHPQSPSRPSLDAPKENESGLKQLREVMAELEEFMSRLLRAPEPTQLKNGNG